MGKNPSFNYLIKPENIHSFCFCFVSEMRTKRAKG